MIFLGGDIRCHIKTICTTLETDNHTSTQSHNFYRPHALPDDLPTMSKHSRHGSRHGNLIENFLYHYNLRSVVCFCKLCMISVKVVTDHG